MEFGEKVKELLVKNNITQTKFAEDTDTHKGLLSRYLNGEKPSIDFVYKVISYFPEADLNYLFKNIQEEDLVHEPSETPYKKSEKPEEIIREIEYKLKELKQIVTQK